MRRVRIPTLIGTALISTTLVAGAALVFGGTAIATSGPGSDGTGERSHSSREASSDDHGALVRGRDRARREIRRNGRCTGSSRWKFKVKNEDNRRLEVEFQVDQNRNGRRWGVALKQNGRKVLRRAYRTRAPSGSFEARKITRDRNGRDRMVAIARDVRSGERCTARITF